MKNLFIVTLVAFIFGITGCSSNEPFQKSFAETKLSANVTNSNGANANVATKTAVVEKDSEDHTDEDVVGFYFQGRLNQANPGRWTNGRSLEVKRLQGIIQIDEDHHSDNGKTEVSIMNHHKKGGMSGFAAIIPNGLSVSMCGKAISRKELYPLVNDRRMVVKGTFKVSGEGEGSEYVWQKLDFCHIE